MTYNVCGDQMNSWKEFLEEESKKDYFIKLNKFLDEEYQVKEIFPLKEDIFNAFKYTEISDIKVVILGQDPYHQVGQAHGLAFSVKCDKLPPSLKNIYKEIYDDCGISNTQGDLTSWAKQGVFLLNTTLTVEKDKPKSHYGYGWEEFTDEVITLINSKDRPVVFVLWGSSAISKKKLITNSIHHIIETVHPSPLSSYRGFFGSKVFSRCNEYLINDGYKPIDWKIDCE